MVHPAPAPKFTYTLTARRDADLAQRLYHSSRQGSDRSHEEAYADRLRYIIIASALLENATSSNLPTPLYSAFQDKQIVLPCPPPRQFRHFKFTLTKLLLWAIPPAFASVPVVNATASPALALLGGWKAAVPPLLLAGLVLTLQITQSIEVKDRREALVKDVEALLALCKEADSLLQEALQFITVDGPSSSKPDAVNHFHVHLDLHAPSLANFRNNRDQAERDELRMHTIMLRRCMHDAIAEAIKAYRLASEALVHMCDQTQLDSLLEMYAVNSKSEVPPEEPVAPAIPETPVAASKPASVRHSQDLRELQLSKSMQSSPMTRQKSFEATPKRQRASWSHAPTTYSPSPKLLSQSVNCSSSPTAAPINLRFRRRKDVHSMEIPSDTIQVRVPQRKSGGIVPLQLGSPLSRPSSVLLERRRSMSPTVLEASQRLQEKETASAPMQKSVSSPVPQLAASLPVGAGMRRRSSLAPSDSPLRSPISQHGQEKRFSFLSQASSPNLPPTDYFHGPDELSLTSLSESIASLTQHRKRFLCGMLAIQSKRYSSTVDLAFISRAVRAIDTSTSTLILDVRHAIDRIRWHKILDTPPIDSAPRFATYAPLPGAYLELPISPIGVPREKDASPSSSTLRDFCFAPTKDDQTQVKEACQRYRRHLGDMGLSLQNVASKLNDNNRRLSQYMRAQDQTDVSSDNEDDLIARHDSIRFELETLFEQWKDSRLLVRALAKPKHVRRSLQVHAGDIQNARDIDDIFSDTPDDENLGLSTSTSSKGRRASSSLFSSEFPQTPESRSPARVHIADEYFGGDNPLGLVVEEEEHETPTTQVFEGVAGDSRRAALQKLTRQQRIQLSKEVREESASENTRRDSLGFSAPVMSGAFLPRTAKIHIR